MYATPFYAVEWIKVRLLKLLFLQQVNIELKHMGPILALQQEEHSHMKVFVL